MPLVRFATSAHSAFHRSQGNVMRTRTRILTSIAAVLLVGLVTLAVAISRNAACGDAPALPQGALMRAVMARCYGSPEVLKIERVAKPVPGDHEVLIKVHAAAVNPLDWHTVRGEPYVMRLSSGFGAPDDARIGVDFAGVVESVGAAVTRFKSGDAVFGGASGAFAEYVRLRETGSLALKPDNASFEQAAALPIAAITALQAVRDHARIQPGQTVLINGASGGVGTYAVQIARALGAEVTGVCSTRNVELVRSLGADHVIDYTKNDFTQAGVRYDAIIDNVGNHPLLDRRRALKPGGVLVIVGGQSDDPWLGPVTDILKAIVLSPFVDEEFAKFMAHFNQPDLEFLADLMRQDKLTSVIDRRYAFDEVSKAVEYLETGRARGKVVVMIEES